MKEFPLIIVSLQRLPVLLQEPAFLPVISLTPRESLKMLILGYRSWIEKLADAGYRCVNVGKMHSYPYHTPLGFHERYVVENKDRYLEERYYFDEWDKALPRPN